MLIIAFRSGLEDRAEEGRPTGLRKRGGTGASTCRRTIERIQPSGCSVRFRQRCGSAQNRWPHCGRARRVSRAGPRRRRTRRGAGRAGGRRPGAAGRSGSGLGGVTKIRSLEPDAIESARPNSLAVHISLEKLVSLGCVSRDPKIPLKTGGSRGLEELIGPTSIAINLYISASGKRPSWFQSKNN